MTLLLREGLLHEYDENRRICSRLRIQAGDSVSSMKAQLLRGLSPDLREALTFTGMQLNGLWIKAKTRPWITLLPYPVVRTMIVPIAFLCGPSTLTAAMVLEAAWLAWNLPAFGDVFRDYFTLDGFDKTGVLALVFVSILFHELCHAAAGFRRNGANGEVRLGIMAWMPYCFTTIPGFHAMTRPDRLAVLSSGIVGQLALAIIVLILSSNSGWIYTASEMAIIVALFNLLPIPGLDGHGILRELRDRSSRNIE